MSGNGHDNRTHQIRSIMLMRIAAYLLTIEYMGYMRLLQSIKGIWQEPDGTAAVGPDGGTIHGPGGITTYIPEGAFDEYIPIRVAMVSEDAISEVQMHPELKTAGVFQIDSGGATPNEELKISIPAPEWLTPEHQILLAKVINIRGVEELTLACPAVLRDGKIYSTSPPFEGVMGDGTYEFVSWIDPEKGTAYVKVDVWKSLSIDTYIAGDYNFVYDVPYQSKQTIVVTIPVNRTYNVDLATLDGEALDTVSIMGPPERGEFYPETIDLIYDPDPPTVSTVSIPDGSMDVFPYEGFITAGFSEALDPATVNSDTVSIKDSSGNKVEGTIYLADNGTTIVFDPKYGYKYCETYTFRIDGVKDWGGNQLQGQSGNGLATTFSTYCPRMLASAPAPVAMAIDTYRNNVAVKGWDPSSPVDMVHSSHLWIFDVSDPADPVEKGGIELGGYVQDLKVLEDATVFDYYGNAITGDFAVAAGGRSQTYSSLDLVNITDPSSMNIMGEVYLSWSPQYGSPPGNVPAQSGASYGVTLLGTNAYVATYGIGVQAVDLLEVKLPTEKLTWDIISEMQEKALGGTFTGSSYMSVSKVRNNILAVKNGTLSILGPSLNILGQLGSLNYPYLVEGAEAFPIDVDNDGRVGTAEDNDSDPTTSAQESFDLAFISTVDGIVVVDVTTPNAPRKIDLIPIPSGVVKVDREKRLAYTTGMSIISLKALSLNTPPDQMGLRDADGDNMDDRLLYAMPEASGMDIAMSEDGNIAYIADYAHNVMKVVEVSGNNSLYVYPDEDTEVSADDAAVYIVASVTDGKDENGDPIPAEDGSTIEWFIKEGAGGSISEQQSQTKDGFAVITLSTSSHPGDTYKVGARLKTIMRSGSPINVDNTADITNSITVTPGSASEIIVTKSEDHYAADENDSITVTATVNDQFGNPVEDGSPIYWELDGLGEILEDQGSVNTFNGQAQAIITPGFLAENQNVTVQADSVEQPDDIEVTEIQISLISDRDSIDVHLGEKATLTATFKDIHGNYIADGAEISWFASNGKIFGDSIVIDGSASAILDATDGRVDSALVSVAVGNFVKSIRIPFVSTAQTWMKAEHPVIVGDESIDGLFDVLQYDGSVFPVPYYTDTKVDIYGAPGAVATLWTTAMLPIASYPFDEIVSNHVNDAIGSNHGLVNGATIDTQNVSNGLASLSFDGDDNVVIANSPSLDVSDSITVSAWIRPTTLNESFIVNKELEYSVSINEAGYPSFSILTSDGTFTVTSDIALSVGYWYWIKGAFNDDEITISVNSLTTNAPASGIIIPGSMQITVGDAFIGNIDSFVISKNQIGAGGLVELTGVDANGKTQLDSSGHAVVHLRSTGIMFADTYGEEIDINIVASPQNKESVKVVPKKWYSYLYNLGRGFVWGDGEGIESTAGDFVAGMTFGIGDVRDILKNLAYVWPGGKEPDWVHFGFAVVGFATEFVPIGGEAPDAVITGVKVILPKIGKSVFRTSLVKVAKKMFSIAGTEGIGAAVAYAKQFSGLLKSLINKGDEVIASFNALIKSPKTLERVAKLHDVMGDEIVDVLASITKNSDLGPRVANKVALTLGHGVDDAILDSIKNSGKMADAIDGLAKALKSNVNPEEIKKVLNNDFLFNAIAKPPYTYENILIDIGKVADVKGLDKLMQRIRIPNPQSPGSAYELLVGAKFVDQNKVVEFFSKIAADGTDIDIIADGIYYQVKNGAKALGYGEEGAKDVRLWILRAKADGAEVIKYVLPPDNPKIVTQVIQEVFDEYGIEVIRVPFQ